MAKSCFYFENFNFPLEPECVDSAQSDLKKSAKILVTFSQRLKINYIEITILFPY